jgi:hypothetical protein
MTDGVQIHPKISVEVFKRLEDVKSQQGHTRGDIVEAALRQYLWPKSEATKVEEALNVMVQILGKLAHDIDTLLDQRQGNPMPDDADKSAGEPLPVATYEQMYGPITKPEASPPTRRRWPWKG